MPSCPYPNGRLAAALHTLNQIAARTDLPLSEVVFPATVTRGDVREHYGAYVEAMTPIAEQMCLRHEDGDLKGQPVEERQGETVVRKLTPEGQARLAELNAATVEVRYEVIQLAGLSGLSGDALEPILPFLDVTQPVAEDSA